MQQGSVSGRERQFVVGPARRHEAEAEIGGGAARVNRLGPEAGQVNREFV